MRISGTTRLVGIIGHPVAHSLSPAIHNAVLTALGLDYIYVPLPVTPADVPMAVAGLQAAVIAGFNGTIPHKTAVIPLHDRLSA